MEKAWLMVAKSAKKLQKPFHSEASAPTLYSCLSPALPCLPSHLQHQKKKKKSESKAENESSPEVTAAPFKEKSRNKGELALT